MKKIILISSLMAAGALSAAPLVTIGDQLDLFAKGEFKGSWDSNVTYSANNKINDYAGKFVIGGEADYGRNSKFKANVKFQETLTRYAQHKDFNSNLFSLFAVASYVETALKVDAAFSFVQSFQNSSTTTAANQAGSLVRSDVYNASINGSYDFTEKLFGELGFTYYGIEYQGNWGSLYSDQYVYSVPVSVLYRVTEKISAGLSYTYRYTEFDGGLAYNNLTYGSNRNDHSLGLTVRGQLLPKLSAMLYGGWTIRDPDGGTANNGSEDLFALRAELGYELTEKIALFATGKRDFGSGAQRQSSINTGCEVGANYRMTDFITATTSFSYENAEYQQTNGRNDDTYIARIGLSYAPNKFITISTNYRYYNNSSNIDNCTYNQHLVDVNFRVRY